MEDIKDQFRDGIENVKEMLGPMQKCVTPTSALVGLGAGLTVYWLIKRNKYKLPPGPTPIPLVGNYSLMMERGLQEECVKLAEKYGPVFTIYMGPLRMVIVNTIEAATQVLVKAKADFADRMPTTFGDALSDNGKDIAFSQYTVSWKLHRKIAGTALRNYFRGGKLEEAIHGSCSHAIKAFEEKKGEPFVPHECIDLTVFNVMVALCFQNVYTFDDSRFKRLVDLDNELLLNVGAGFVEDLLPILAKTWPTKRYARAMEILDEIFEFVNGELRNHKETFDEGNIRDFADALILARMEAENDEDTELLNQLTDVHLKQTMIDVFFAGIDTTRFTLQWFFLYLAANPEIQKKAQKEIDNAVGRDRLPGLADRPSMPYTEAVLHETMRIATVAPLGVPHAARVDAKLCGYDVPKGTAVVINHWALHNDARHWNDPKKFDPERFLDSDGNLAQKPVSWLPFSAGRRVCLGESIAKAELHVIAAIILQQFDLMLPQGVAADFSPEISSFVGYTANRYKIVLKKRS
ncbi:steroid 17-alpha-hydroxylase/17,20 lyase-like [Pecten maximus]|uniref:steroid 17-alpha-hydroxylase/17,20 lyase-like n=1 Tax=Pecten maximus TaxID=6579 RepID=UPI0014586BD5|nr:steroid 17-alpha-hydroxylase/17,20 lyase-like [Pecten maximus]XP_033763836.1 steroid 17-alpha-hydroxylase/17,20 lyase-like [Pecten maximus]